MGKNCPYCNSPIKEKDSFCGECGKRIEIEEKIEIQEQIRGKSNRGLKIAAISAAGIAFLFLVIGGMLLFMKGRNLDKTKDLVHTVEKSLATWPKTKEEDVETEVNLGDTGEEIQENLEENKEEIEGIISATEVSVDEIKEEKGMSIDNLFREVFKC